MERSKFWAFVFSFMPGAGEMYLGLKRKGTEIMLIFLGIFFLSMTFNFGPFSIFMAVIWFYSFFDTMDLSRMKHSERILLEDKFIFGTESIDFSEITDKVLKNKNIVGWVCIVLGAYIIYNNVFQRIIYDLMWQYEMNLGILPSLISSVPTIILAVVIIYFGLKLIKSRNEIIINNEVSDDFEDVQDNNDFETKRIEEQEIILEEKRKEDIE